LYERISRIESNIERETDPGFSEKFYPGTDLDRLLDGGATDDHASHARGKKFIDDRKISDAATDLHRQLWDLGYIADDFPVRDGAVASAIEVDDMEPSRSEHSIPRCERCRFDVVHGLLLKIAMQQPNALAATQIDGGYQSHDLSFKKLESSRAPDFPERSG
jgi:hypothetical protein